MSQQPAGVTPSPSPFQLSQSPYEAGWIEESLYYRGETPPSGHGKSEDWVQIPHEGYIPVSKAQVVQALQRRAGSASEGEFHHFCELMEGSLSVESTLGEGATFFVRVPRAIEANDA